MLDNNDIVKLSEVFATKEELQEMKEVLKSDILEFKNEILTGQDEIMGKLDKLLGEKTVGDEQDKRKTKVLEIHNDALKTKKILSDSEVSQIEKLHAF
jgi:hypothetical protein